MKRRKTFLLVAVVLFSMTAMLAACGNDDTPAKETINSATITPDNIVSTPVPEADSGDSTPSQPDGAQAVPTETGTPSTPDNVQTTTIQSGPKLFSGLEWTGQTNSMDVNGKTVNQSSIVSIGEIDYHSNTTIVYKDLQEAYQGATTYSPEVSSYYKLLTGEGNTWQLAVYRNETLAKKAGLLDFYKTDYDMSQAPKYEGNGRVSSFTAAYYGGFKEVTLPASWVVYGFDFPIYTNTQYPWDNDAYLNGSYGEHGKFYVPVAPVVTNPVGFYRTSFDIDPEWIASGRRIYISFQGVESAYYLYVNGQEVGYSESSFDASDFDITAYLNKDGKDNLLAVKVHRWCDGSYFENQDYMRLAGIFRDVYVYSLPGVHIADYTVVTDLDEQFVDANLQIETEVFNSTVSDVEEGFFQLDVSLIDAVGKPVFEKEPFDKSVSAIASGETELVSLSRKVEAPHLWSDEDPYLYTLVISMYDKNGVCYGSISQQLGFREITFTRTAGTSANTSVYDTMLLNGKPLFFRGVNRHDTNPETGRYLPHELIEKDIQIMKQLNVNAVRTSHYPDDRYFYDMCDKYGILVMAECNIETHYAVSDAQTKQYFEEVIKDRVLSHTQAYKNRTCVVMWSIGNETCSGAQIFPSIISTLKKNDPTRPVHFESLGNRGGVDVSSSMYSSSYDVKNRANAKNKMPYVICEYAHAMGNSLGSLYEYGLAFRSSDVLLGGFIWDFVDQALWTPISSSASNPLDYYNNGKFLGYGGTWGDSPNSGNFMQNGIISADRTLQPECAEVKYVYQYIWFSTQALTRENRMISIYNEHRFSDLSEFDYRYELLCDGKVIDSGSFELDGKPGETIAFEVPYQLPEKLEADGEYKLNVYACLAEDTGYAKKGYIVASEQLDIFVEIPHAEPDCSEMSDIAYSETDAEIIVSGEKFIAVFEKASGMLMKYTYNDEEIITGGPAPNFARATLDNDRGAFSWDRVKNSGADSITVSKSADGKCVTVKTVLRLSSDAGTEEVNYTVYGDGQIAVENKLNPAPEMGEMHKFGALIILPGDYENIVFYGNGPEDSYNDRQQGTHLGVWTTTVTDSFYPYPRPQDTGNKTGVRYFSLTSDNKNTGILIVAKKEIEASALHYTVEELKSKNYVYRLNPDTTATYLNIDYGSRGTGGASCGPDTLSQYCLYNDGRDYSYTYTIVPYNKKEADVDALYRVWHVTDSMTEEDIDKYFASLVDNAINGLTTMPEKVKEVREAFDALTAKQKTYVKNLNVLETVEKGSSRTVVILDQSPNDNTGELEKGYIFTDASSPNGYAIDGYFMSGDNGGKINQALSGANNFTIGAFVKMKDLNADNVILAKGDTQVAMKIQSGGMLEFFVFRGNWDAIINVSPTEAGLASGQWAYVVGVREGSDLRLYVNGKLVGSASNASGNISTNNTAFGIGADPSMNRYGRSSFAYAHVLPFAATQEQIKTTYEALCNGTTPAYTAEDAVLWYDSSEYEYR